MDRTIKLAAWANIALLRAASSTQRHHISQFAVAISKLEHEDYESDENLQYKEKQAYNKVVKKMNWVPHPRSGIYCPQGQECVIDGVPCNAATLGQGQTYWLRNFDGVEKYDPDISSADHYLLTHPHPA